MWRLPTLLLLLCAPLVSQRPLPDDRAGGGATITTDALRSWLTTLASTEYAGRGTGSDGFGKAAALMRDHFAEIGLAPFGDEGSGERSYWQAIPWTRLRANPDETALVVSAGQESVLRLTPGQGLHGQATGSSDAAGPVALVVIRERDRDALSDMDLEGKIVLLQVSGGRLSQRLIRELRSGKPAAWLAVDDDACERYPSLAGMSRPGAGAANRAIRGRGVAPNRLYTTSSTVTDLLAAAGVEAPADDTKEPTLLDLPGLTGQLDVKVLTAQAPAYNVVGVLPGTDPELRDEYVVIGSHLDHLGDRRGTIYPGADDDGSGSVGVMAVARAFAQNPTAPRRSVLFVTFCGEELGLVGSDFFVKNSPIPLGSIVAQLQLDMIGRDEESGNERASDNTNSLHLIGTKKLSAELHDLCLRRNELGAGFDLEWDEEDVFFRSDHFNFARAGIPIAFFFTGFHADYHKPTDTVEKINFDKLARVARYVYDIAFELAMADGRPMVDAERWASLRSAMRGRAPEQPAAPMKKQ